MYQSQANNLNFDESMFSSSNLPYKYPCLAEGHELQAAVPTWAAQCLQAYNNTAVASQQPLTHGPRPHRRRTTRRRKTTKAQPPRPTLACPFYRRNPERHHACAWTVTLGSVRSAKQHVIVHHHAPIYCPVCTAHFPSAVARDRHVRARACVAREPAPGSLEGATEDQVDRLLRCDTAADGDRDKDAAGATARYPPRRGHAYLARRPRLVNKGDKEQESWFRMWDVLFPGVGRPNAAYLTSPREREIVALRKFWKRVGPAVVKGLLALDRADLATREAVAGSVLRDMVQQAGLGRDWGY